MLVQGRDLIPIPGTKHVSYLEENIAPVDIQLTDEDMQLFDALHVYGKRDPEVNRRFVQA